MRGGIHAIILCAGASERLGFPKALVRFGKRTALQIAVDNVIRAGLPRPWVVLGHAAPLLQPYAKDTGARVVVHPRWKEGQLSSFLAGLRKVPRSAAGFMLYPVDYPLLRPADLLKLLRAFEREPDREIFCPWHRGHGGHPVLFRARLRKDFEQLAPGRSARDVVYRDSRRVLFVPIASDAHRRDFDTIEDVRRLTG